MAQIKAVTVRAAKTNIVMGLFLRQRLPHPLTDGNCRHWRRRDLKQFTPRRSSSSDLREVPMVSHIPVNTAPRDGTLIRLWCRSKAEPVTGYWSRTFIGWVAYHEPIPLIRHDVTGWEPIADQAAARAMPLEKVRQTGATTVVLGR
jgi:hypothetical protein